MIRVLAAMAIVAGGACESERPPKRDLEGHARPHKVSEAIDAAAVADPALGAPACDELIALTRCMHGRVGTAVPDVARRAFEDSIATWRAGLAEPALRSAVIESCQASLDGGRAGFAALGCVTELEAPAARPAFATGSAACDDLLTRLVCAMRKIGQSDELNQAFATAADTWTALIADPATRLATVDACTRSLAASRESLEAQGCGDAEAPAP